MSLHRSSVAAFGAVAVSACLCLTGCSHHAAPAAVAVPVSTTASVSGKTLTPEQIQERDAYIKRALAKKRRAAALAAAAKKKKTVKVAAKPKKKAETDSGDAEAADEMAIASTEPAPEPVKSQPAAQPAAFQPAPNYAATTPPPATAKAAPSTEPVEDQADPTGQKKKNSQNQRNNRRPAQRQYRPRVVYYRAPEPAPTRQGVKPLQPMPVRRR